MSEATAEVVEETPPRPKLVYEVELDVPGLPKGELVQIPGLGTYENKSTFDVDADQHTAYRAHNSVQELIYGGESGEEIIGSTVVPGPTLLQASKNMFGVEVAVYGKQPSEGDDE